MGIIEQIKEASSLEEVKQLCEKAETYEQMSPKTRRRCERTLSTRIAFLKKQKTEKKLCSVMTADDFGQFE